VEKRRKAGITIACIKDGCDYSRPAAETPPVEAAAKA
jgi:hypothetical protein